MVKNIVFEDDLAVSRFYLIYLLVTVCTFKRLHVNNEIGLLSFHPQILASLTSTTTTTTNNDENGRVNFLVDSPPVDEL